MPNKFYFLPWLIASAGYSISNGKGRKKLSFIILLNKTRGEDIFQYSRSKVELILNFKVIGVQLFRNKIVRQITGTNRNSNGRQDLCFFASSKIKFLPSYKILLVTLSIKKKKKKPIKRQRSNEANGNQFAIFPRCRQSGYPDLRQLQGDVYGSGRVARAQAELLQTAVHM